MVVWAGCWCWGVDWVWDEVGCLERWGCVGGWVMWTRVGVGVGVGMVDLGGHCFFVGLVDCDFLFGLEGNVLLAYGLEVSDW